MKSIFDKETHELFADPARLENLSELEKAIYGLEEMDTWVECARAKLKAKKTNISNYLQSLPKVTFTNNGAK